MTTGGTAARRVRAVLSGDLATIYAIMIVVIVGNAVLQGNLVANGNLTDLLVQVAPYVLVAMAQTIVMLLAGVDLSVGALMSLASTVFATRMAGGAADFGVILVVLALCACVGALTGALICALRLPAIVVTLALSFVWDGLALAVLPTPGGKIPQGTALWIVGEYSRIPLAGVLLAVCCVVWALIRRSRTGLHLLAVGADSRAARTSGLTVWRSYAFGYGAAAVLAALAALVISAQTGSGDPRIGDPYTLPSVAAAVLGGVSFFGGRGKMLGSVAGGVVLGMLANLLLYAQVSSFYQYVVEGAILIVAVAINARRRRGRTATAHAAA
jgi:ribose transport system permease protein